MAYSDSAGRFAEVAVLFVAVLFWLQVGSLVLVLLFLPQLLRMTYSPAYSAMTFPPGKH